MFTIKENGNYKPGEGNLFLMHEGRCVGGADQNLFTGKWFVTVNKPLDVETDSDAMLIAECDDQRSAWTALWEARFQAYLG